jgi:hypothetical protein
MDWRDIIFLVLAGLVAFFGAPIIQLIKNFLSLIFRKPVDGRWAVLLSVILAAGLAFLEMFLTGQLQTYVITLKTFPEFFIVIWGVAQGYFAWFKNSDSGFGRSGLLKKLKI